MFLPFLFDIILTYVNKTMSNFGRGMYHWSNGPLQFGLVAAVGFKLASSKWLPWRCKCVGVTDQMVKSSLESSNRQSIIRITHPGGPRVLGPNWMTAKPLPSDSLKNTAYSKWAPFCGWLTLNRVLSIGSFVVRSCLSSPESTRAANLA